ncbi:MAG: Crp/Fnr family transcriptional regulator [Acidobacteriota bacterium]|nr:Crp/Fnr family transcriptional regulator [Acidobacteriota bacterium]
MTKRELLSAVPFFGELDEEALATLESGMGLRKFRRGQPIFSQGDPGDSLFLVASGRVKLFIESTDGEQLTILFCDSGSCFGEMAVLDGKVRSASAEAVEPTETWIVTRNTFLDLMRRAPDIAIAVITFLCSKLRGDLDRMEEFIFLDTYDRVGRQLLRMATKDPSGDYSVQITQDELARLVGNSREQVNRVLADLSSLGHVSIGRGCLKIARPDALKRMFGKDET